MDRTKIGRYEILGELGRGAMGAVLRARDPVMGRDVAIKCILSAALAGDQMNEFRERFNREARAAGALSHPGIVPVFDVGEDDGIPYLVMELVQGRTLDGVLKEGHRYSLERTCEIGQQLAEALGFAHRNGIIHRDIKPANILMTSAEVYDTERPRITDFGVAKLVGRDMTNTGQLLGTPAFMPPEQFTGAPIDHRTDLFALGVILYGMATGEQPFSGETLTAVSYKVVHTDPIPPSKLNPAIPPQLEAVILKCLAKNPAARYQTGEALAADLARVRAEALDSGAGPGAMRTMSVMDSGAGDTINQVASLRPKASPARTFAAAQASVAPVAAATQSLPPGSEAWPGAEPAGTGASQMGSAFATQSAQSLAGTVFAKPTVAPAVAAQPKAAANRRMVLIASAGVVLLAAGAGAGFLLHRSPPPAPQQAQAPVQPAPAQNSAQPPAAVAPAPVLEPAKQPEGRKERAEKKKPEAGKAPAINPPPAPAAVVAKAAPAAPAPAAPAARPAPAPAPVAAAVAFNPKTLDPESNAHLKLNLDGFSASLMVTLQMDGKVYWSGPAGDKKGYQGLFVPPGQHTFRVLVKGQNSTKSSNTVNGDFPAKKHMSLSVKLRPEVAGDSSLLDPSSQIIVTLKKELFPF